jgi:general L-amino acid transport system permease protein
MSASNGSFVTSLQTNFKRNLWNWRTIAQLIFLAIIITCSILAWNTLARNMRNSGLAISFDFLGDPASFDIADSPFPYKASDSYTKALQVGLLNSLKAIAVSIISATVVGVTVGATGSYLRRSPPQYAPTVTTIFLVLGNLFNTSIR